MPVIAVNLAAKTFAEIAQLVDRGLYVSPEQFLEIAAFNQLALERGSKPDEIVAGGNHRNGSSKPSSGGEDAADVVLTVPRPRVQRAVRKREQVRTPAIGRKHSGKFEADGAELVEVVTRLSLKGWNAELPAPEPAEPRPEGERLWGQVNRLFPLKLATRWLGVEASAAHTWPRLEDISDRLADDAATIGSALERADAAADRKRDEVLATGLPRRGNSASRDRFLSQFIARVTRGGEIYPGALVQYGLGAFDGDRITLTEAGIRIARENNPVLDESPSAATRTLSERERELFIDVVAQLVPGEAREFQALVAAIAGGSDTPDALLSGLRSQLPEHWSPLMARTHVAGVVARASELGLVQRIWEGRNVRYRLTDCAATFGESGNEEMSHA